MKSAFLNFIEMRNQRRGVLRPENNGARILERNSVALLIEGIHPSEPAFAQTFHKPFRVPRRNVGRAARRKDDGRDDGILFMNGGADSRHDFLPLHSQGNRIGSVGL